MKLSMARHSCQLREEKIDIKHKTGAEIPQFWYRLEISDSPHSRFRNPHLKLILRLKYLEYKRNSSI